MEKNLIIWNCFPWETKLRVVGFRILGTQPMKAKSSCMMDIVSFRKINEPNTTNLNIKFWAFFHGEKSATKIPNCFVYQLFEFRRIVVGFHPLVACDENIERIEARQAFELLHHIFLKHGVVSEKSPKSLVSLSNWINIRFLCLHFVLQDGYLSGTDQTDKGPYFTTVDKNLVTHKWVNLSLISTKTSNSCRLFFNIVFPPFLLGAIGKW